jgi:Coenzyme PQQ synthesis protein D (PqqD)
VGEADGGNGDPGLRAMPFVLRSDGMTWRALDDQIVVLDLETSLYLNVTGSGAVVWPLLAAGTTVDAMVGAVLEVYDIDAETARGDIVAFLDDLRERKLLR